VISIQKGQCSQKSELGTLGRGVISILREEGSEQRLEGNVEGIQVTECASGEEQHGQRQREGRATVWKDLKGEGEGRKRPVSKHN
jgi:hypothetical protein